MLAVTGDDRIAFLTRIMSGDLPRAPAAARTALLGPKGNLIAPAVATVVQDSVFLECERARQEALLRALDRYRIADDVEIRSVDLETADLRRLEGAAPPEGPQLDQPGAVLESDGGFLRRDFRPWPAFTRFRGAGAPLPAGEGACDGQNRNAGAGEQEYLRILAGEPRWGAELDETSLPLMSGLAAHVRLGKGCYIGQEYVARQAHRGRAPRVLRGLEFEGGARVPLPGAEVRFEGRSIGRLTSVAVPPEGWPVPARGLAVLAAEAPADAAVEADAEPGPSASRVVALP